MTGLGAAPMERAIVWLRRDLRLHDHRPFFEATHAALQVLPIFIIDTTIVDSLPAADRRVTFIQACLDEMQEGLARHGGKLLVVRGDPTVLVPKLAAEYKVQAVFTGRDYEPATKKRDAVVDSALKRAGVRLVAVKDQVMFESREILNGSKEPYKVFTPYSRAWLKMLESKRATHLHECSANFKRLMPASAIKTKSVSFFDQKFKPQEISIAGGEKAARRSLKSFTDAIRDYGNDRNFPAVDGTSSLSPHFRFGTLSIREAVRFCYEHFSAGAKVWLTELIWRDFYQMILDQFPHVDGHAFRPEYDKIKWIGKKSDFEAWCEGRTGFPIVDAAMRQLNETGWMHNRLRMIVASFLTKDLLIDWRWGEEYFARQLLDFDLAANNGGWQWSASTGCDAQPYFRIFNPVSQSEKFDPSGDFIRRFVPELKKLDDKKIHWPHDEGLFGVGGDYPEPIVDHAVQRDRALKMYKAVK
ncbi:MAG: deoxyribodipyrimidine photo-lyase [Bdellovibrionales bacterium]|nr:deoxyribodipyrimidine photo-lyase [Bdellovibrionales bacterium]